MGSNGLGQLMWYSMADGGSRGKVDVESFCRQRRSGISTAKSYVERIPETEPRRFYVLSDDMEAHGRTGGCLVCAAVASHGRGIKPQNDECRERIRTIIE